ncbi:MAG TPA: hypothetical protein V6C98_02470, partial [Thermosynechococcaceae cyanobacterium]
MVQSPVRTQESGDIDIASSLRSTEVGRSSLTKPPLASKETAHLATASTGWGGLTLPTSRLFGTDGIRGRAGDLLTAPLALQIGFWAGHVLRSQMDTMERSQMDTMERSQMDTMERSQSG